MPDEVNVRQYELAAFTQLRGLRGLHQSWEEIIAVAQRTMAFAEEIEQEKLERLRTTDARGLLAASRSLDAACHEQSGIDPSHRRLLAIEAGLSYAMGGNFTASQAVTSYWFDLKYGGEGWEQKLHYAVVLAAVVPIRIGELIASVGDFLPPQEKSFVEALVLLLEKGGESSFPTVMECWRNVAISSLEDIHKSSLLRGVRPVLHHIAKLSVWTVLKPFRSLLPEKTLENLTLAGPKLLLPSQEAAIEVTQFLRSDSNTLITMGTSTGKTLLGQLCICTALGKSAGLACYIAPYRALAGQIFRTFTNQMPPSIKVERSIGGYSPSEKLQPSEKPTVLVATPERFDAILRHQPELMDHLRCVVFDEAHIIEQADRGIRIEGLLARLRMQQARGKNIRLVLLSAVLTDTRRIREWLQIPDELVVRSDWRPTARRLALWRQDGRLDYFYSDDPLLPAGIDPTRVIAGRNIPWPSRLFASPTTGSQLSQIPASNANVAYLCKQLVEDFHAPILCVCGTKSLTRSLASTIAGSLSPIAFPTQHVQELQILIHQRWSHLRQLSFCLEKGVAYHNASLPSQVKELIESATNAGELRVVVATTTLAEGVNLPFRFTVIADWLRWTDEGQHPMSSLLFRNIAGRCGRAGSYSEGDTIIYDNPIGNYEHTQPYGRSDRIVERLIAPRQVAIRSPLTEDPSVSEPEKYRQRRMSALSSQYLAAVQENEGSDNLADLFYESLLASEDPSNYWLMDKVHGIEEDMLTGDGLALAQRNSPLSLTTFGRSCILSGLSPSSCRTLVHFLDEMDEPESSANLLSSLLNRASGLAEASSTNLEKVYKKKTRFPVKQSDFDAVIVSWLQGTPLEAIFSKLPYSQKSRKKILLMYWIKGLDKPNEWDDDFDKFHDFVTGVLVNYLSWICRAIEFLHPFSNQEWPGRVSWKMLADFLEYGVDTFWAAIAVREGCPASRSAIASFGRTVERLYGPGVSALVPEAALAGLGGSWIQLALEYIVDDPYMDSDFAAAEIDRITEWLRRRTPLPN